MREWEKEKKMITPKNAMPNKQGNETSDLFNNQFAYQKAKELYEKGLLSKNTLLKIAGFDPEEEKKESAESSIEKVAVVSNRVEQARRNIEVLSKILLTPATIRDALEKDFETLKEVFRFNLLILKEVDKIK